MPRATWTSTWDLNRLSARRRELDMLRARHGVGDEDFADMLARLQHRAGRPHLASGRAGR